MSALSSIRERLHQGIVTDNPAAHQLLGLCPLLAVSHTFVNALGLAAASLFVLLGSSVLISALARFVPREVRLPGYMLIIGSFTTIAVQVLEAFAYDLYVAIALFVQIIVTNCIILAQAERVAARLPVAVAFLDAAAAGLGFTLVLVTLGAVREIMGHGTLFAGLDSLFGPGAAAWRIEITDGGALIAALPPGAFLIFGLLLALLRARPS